MSIVSLVARNRSARKSFALSGVIGAAALAALSVPASANSSPLGVWMNDTGRGAIEITDCDGKLCGEVVWVNDAKDANGCGRQILGNVKKVGSNIWDNGWVYSPERKKRYDVELKLLSEDKLRVKGYAGIKMFSKTLIWTRAPADLKRCGDAPANSSEQIASRSEPQPTDTRNQDARVREDQPIKRVERAEVEPRSERDIRGDNEPRREARAEPIDEPRNDDVNINRNADDNSEGERRGIDLGSLDLGGINIDNIFTRSENGDCKLDTPWVKLNFKCRERGESSTN